VLLTKHLDQSMDRLSCHSHNDMHAYVIYTQMLTLLIKREQLHREKNSFECVCSFV
jgi:hypothetical protein